MVAVVTRACVGTKDRACVDACPVEAFHEGDDQLYVHPEVCIDCVACVALCPVNAIYMDGDVPAERRSDIELNALVFTDQHQDGCGCGYCDATGKAFATLPVARSKRF